MARRKCERIVEKKSGSITIASESPPSMRE